LEAITTENTSSRKNMFISTPKFPHEN